MDTVLTLEEAAGFLKVHPTTLYRLLKQHRIPAFRVGSDWRFNQDSIQRWIKDQEGKTAKGHDQGPIRPTQKAEGRKVNSN